MAASKQIISFRTFKGWGGRERLKRKKNSWLGKHEAACATLPLHLIHSSNSVLPGPFARCGFIPRTVGLVNMGNFGYQWIIRVRVCEHRADREQNLKKRMDVSTCGLQMGKRKGEIKN